MLLERSNYIFIPDLTPGFNGLQKDKVLHEDEKHFEVLGFGATFVTGLTV